MSAAGDMKRPQSWLVVCTVLLVLSTVACAVRLESAPRKATPPPYTANMAPYPSALRSSEVREDGQHNKCGPKNYTCVRGLCVKDKCLCDVGFKGVNCTEVLECGGHGSMQKGGSCKCDSGWSGANCRLGPCKNSCSGNGLCFHDRHNRPRCMCLYGARGDDCSIPGCPKKCSGHGDCLLLSAGDGNENIALCRCHDGYRGQDCGQKGCPMCVHGRCDGDKCVCESGWGKRDCSERTCLNGCSGHGGCDDGVCVCQKGWAGRDCSIPEAKCPNHCSGKGTCTNQGCACLAPYGGPDCSQSCPKNCSGNGVCLHGSCQCLEGFNPPDCERHSCPKNCTGDHGRCEDGACMCKYPWVGTACDHLMCANECSDHGKCLNGMCLCDKPPFPPGSTNWKHGYAGVDCSQKACPGNCTSPARGKCNGATGTCECVAPFVGEDCSRTACNKTCGGHGHCPDQQTGCKCDPGYMGHDCTQKYCLDNCNVHKGQGQCVNFTCVCNPGFTGRASCSQVQCPTALPLDSDLRYKPVEAPGAGFPAGADQDPDPLACTRHGFCINGTCACHNGWKGKACHIKECPKECNKRGVCNIHGVCECNAPWTGLDCGTHVSESADTCPRNCSGRGHCRGGLCYCEHGKYFGKDCSQVRIQCDENCHQNGVCDFSTGICHCHQGRGGSDCAQQICIPSANCSNNGRCVQSDSMYGECRCRRGWAGPACADETCDDPCSGQGACLNGKCFCKPGFGGPKCSEELCPNKCGHGVCLEDGCHCQPGYGGRDCNKQVVQCAHNCSFPHGSCTYHADPTQPYGAKGECVCAPGYQGPGCTEAVCSQGCHEDVRQGKCVSPELCSCAEGFWGTNCEQVVCPRGCSGHGICNGLKCHCYEKWGGDDCSMELVCAKGCDAHGLCVGQTCVCDPGWKGAACDQPHCLHNCSGRGTCDERSGDCKCFAGFRGEDCSDLHDISLCLADCQFRAMRDAQGVPVEPGEQKTPPEAKSEADYVSNCVLTRCSTPQKKEALRKINVERIGGQFQQATKLANRSKEAIETTDTETDHVNAPIWW